MFKKINSKNQQLNKPTNWESEVFLSGSLCVGCYCVFVRSEYEKWFDVKLFPQVWRWNWDIFPTCVLSCKKQQEILCLGEGAVGGSGQTSQRGVRDGGWFHICTSGNFCVSWHQTSTCAVGFMLTRKQAAEPKLSCLSLQQERALCGSVGRESFTVILLITQVM